MKKLHAQAFESPLIINVNRLLEEDTNYTLRVTDYPSYDDDVLNIYKSDERENTIILADAYDEYVIKIDPEKINILVVTTSYDPQSEISESRDIYVEAYQLFRFDSFPENSPMVITEPEFTFYEGYTCHYCAGEYDSDEEEMDCECSEDWIEMNHRVNGAMINNNNPDIDKILKSENIVYFTSDFVSQSGAEYFYILTDQGIHADAAKYKITEKLVQKLGSKYLRLRDKNVLVEHNRINNELSIRIYYKYDYFFTSSVNVFITIGDRKIQLNDETIEEHFKNIINKEILEDLYKYLSLIEDHTWNEEIGFYGFCDINTKELLKYIPNEVIMLLKLVMDKYDFERINKQINLNEIDEIEIILKQGTYNGLYRYSKNDNTLRLTVFVRNGDIENIHIAKLVDQDLVFQMLNFLGKELSRDEKIVNLSCDVRLRKEYCEKLLK